MADIQYINYGDQQIELQALMTRLADRVLKYVQNQPWSNKRKNKFMTYYQDIMSRGLKSATNDTGQWIINTGGDQLQFDTMDKMDREMYEEAAYFIQQQMASLPTRSSQESKKEEVDKSKLPLFDNKKFIEDLQRHISYTDYGGRAFTQDMWDNLDKRNDNGERQRTERTKSLLNYLTSYRDNFDSSKYNFEGGPFKNENDFKSRLNEAIEALRTTTLEDDDKALNRLGIDPRLWFNNGMDDPYTGDKNFTGTYNQYYNEYLPQERKKKAQAIIDRRMEQIKQQQQLSQFAIRSSRPLSNLITRRALADKYKDLNTLSAQLTDYGRRFNHLKQSEMDELISALSYGANQPITNEEWNIIKSNKAYANSNRNRFKKHPEVNNLIYDTATRRAIQIYDTSIPETIDYLHGQSTKDAENTYMNTPRGEGNGLTDADKRDIAATLLDLGAFIDPEAFSGTILALSASGARTWNSVEQRGLWETLTDWKTWADIGTGALGGTQLLGDASSIAKFARGLGKLMTVPAIISAISNVPEARTAWSKIDTSSFDGIVNSVKKLTPQDYHAISSVLVGLLTGKNYLKSNLAERAVLQHSGINTQASNKRREWLNKYGLARTKPTDNQKIENDNSALKVKKTASDGKAEEMEIPIDKTQAEALRKAKPSEINEVARSLGVNIPEGYKIEPNSSFMNSVKRVGGKGNSDVVVTRPRIVSEGQNKNDFDYWISSRSLWDQYKPWSLGTNSNLIRIHNNIMGLHQQTPQQTNNSDNKQSGSQNKQQMLKNSPLKSNIDQSNPQEGRFLDIRHGVVTNDRQTVNNPYPKKNERNQQDVQDKKKAKAVNNGKLSGNFPEQNSFTFKTPNGTDNVVLSINGETYTLTKKSSDGSQSTKAGIELENVQGEILRTLKESFSKDGKQLAIPPNIVKVLQGTAYNWLKRGGRIDRQKIQMYKNYIKK